MLRLIPVLGLLLVLVACTSGKEPSTSSTALTSPVSDRPIFPDTRTPPPTATATPVLDALVPPVSTKPPSGRIAFAAGGSIYTISADGTGLTEVVAGSRDGDEVKGRQNWTSSPAISPDGRQIVFARDLDAWLVSSVGGEARLLASIGDRQPAACPTCASSWTLGASNFAWSTDGRQIFYVTNRIGGSGLSGAGLIDVSTGSVVAYDHQQPIFTGGFLFGVWDTDDGLLGGYPALWDGGTLYPIDPRDGRPVPEQETLPRNTRPGALWRLNDDLWLSGSWVNGKPILLLSQRAGKQLTVGVSPSLSPDKNWVAYFQDESLRLVRTDGRDDHELVDLKPLGGRDRHFASQPDCFPGNAPACSYRPPLISWTGAR